MVSKQPSIEVKGYTCIDGVWFKEVGLAGSDPRSSKPVHLVERGYTCIDDQWYRTVEVSDTSQGDQAPTG